MITFLRELLLSLLFVVIIMAFILTYKTIYSYAKKCCNTMKNNENFEQSKPQSSNFFNSIIDQFSQYNSDLITRIKTINKHEYTRNMAINLCSIIIIIATFSLLCYTSNGGYDLLVSLALPLLIVSMIIMAFTELYQSDWLLSFLAIILILFGVALQVMLNVSETNGTNRSTIQLVIFATVGLLLAVLAIPVFNFLISRKTIAVYLTIFASILFYIILLLFGSKSSGTTAWITIAGQSFQITEITKLLGFITFAIMFSSEKVSPKKRLLSATIVLMIHAFFLFLISELGTLMMLIIVYVLLGIFYLPSLKIMIKYITVLLLIASIASGIGYACYKSVYAQPDEATEQTTSYVQTINEGQEQNPQKHNKFVVKAANVFNKLRLRIVLVVNPDSVDIYNEGFQANAANKALAMASLMGSEYEQYVPVIESDYIFLFVLMKLGVFGGISVILIMVAMFVLFILKNYLKNTRVCEGALSFAFMSSLIVQALLTTASAIGCFPTVGLPFPFLSLGGSATIMNYIMLIYIIYSGRKNATTTASSNTHNSNNNIGGEICRPKISRISQDQ